MSVQRLDVVEVPDWIASKFEVTPEGYLKGRAAVTNIGVFTYRYGDGQIIRELRSPDEVFKAESVETIKNKPITIDHPKEFVSDETKNVLGVGVSGNEVRTDNIYLSVDLLIQKPEAIDAIKVDGKQFVSCGYSCDVEYSPGRWLGVEYDAVQKNISYNHIALCDSPRAGETARIKVDHMDAADAVLVEKIEEDVMADKVDELNQKLDEVEKLNATLNKDNAELQAKLDALVSEKTALEAERDTLKDKVDGLETKVKDVEAKVLDAASIAEKVTAKVALIDQAKALEVDAKADMSDLDIKKAVITKIFPKAVLEGKPDAYIDARYDSALEYKAESAEASVRELNQENRSDNKDVVAEAKAKYLAQLKKE